MTPDEYKANLITSFFRHNDATHLHNLNRLKSELLAFLSEQNWIGVHKSWHDFCCAEAKRLNARACFMLEHNIEIQPHAHKEQERAILAELREALQQRKKVA